MQQEAGNNTGAAVEQRALPPAEPVDVEALPIAEPIDLHFEQAADQLEKVIAAGAKEPEIFYLLALAYKRQHKPTKARETLARIAKPDANVFLQMGILSLDENQLARAEELFARAFAMAPDCYAAGHNLVMTRLSLGEGGRALETLPIVVQQARTDGESRQLSLMQGLLELGPSQGSQTPQRDREQIKNLFDNVTESEQQDLLKLVESLGNVEIQYRLLKALIAMRTGSQAVREAYFEIVLLKARDLMQHCSWTQAQVVLSPLIHQKSVSREKQVVLHNLLGCCACVTQEFDKAAQHFSNALRAAGNDLRIYQNLALTLELSERFTQAEDQWNEMLDLLERHRCPPAPGIEDYHESLAFECLSRLANQLGDNERWPAVARYLERAFRLRPNDEDVIERLFHAYNNADQRNAAQKMLTRLRAMRPHDPQVDLYELDLVEVKNLADIEHLLAEIENVLQSYPDDHRVEERAVTMVSNVVPLMGNLCDQLTEQLSKVYRQVRNLPRYQIDWTALTEIVRDLVREFRKLKRITAKCLPLVTHQEHRRIVQELQDHIDEKIDACRQLMD